MGRATKWASRQSWLFHSVPVHQTPHQIERNSAFRRPEIRVVAKEFEDPEALDCFQ
jgi:hypothetical protein